MRASHINQQKQMQLLQLREIPFSFSPVSVIALIMYTYFLYYKNIENLSPNEILKFKISLKTCKFKSNNFVVIEH